MHAKNVLPIGAPARVGRSPRPALPASIAPGPGLRLHRHRRRAHVHRRGLPRLHRPRLRGSVPALPRAAPLSRVRWRPCSPCCCVWFGSPLRFYMRVLPSFAHAIEFFAAVLVLVASRRLRETGSPAWAVKAGLACGLVYLVRSQDGLLLVVPADIRVRLVARPPECRADGPGGRPDPRRFREPRLDTERGLVVDVRNAVPGAPQGPSRRSLRGARRSEAPRDALLRPRRSLLNVSHHFCSP